LLGRFVLDLIKSKPMHTVLLDIKSSETKYLSAETYKQNKEKMWILCSYIDSWGYWKALVRMPKKTYSMPFTRMLG